MTSRGGPGSARWRRARQAMIATPQYESHRATSTLKLPTTSQARLEPSASTILGKRKRDSELHEDGEVDFQQLTKVTRLEQLPEPVTDANRPTASILPEIEGAAGTCLSVEAQSAPTGSDTFAPVTSTPSSSDIPIIQRFPNEIVDVVFSYLGPADKACFALTSKPNYAVVAEATHRIPKDLCPFTHGVYNPTMLSIRSDSSHYRILLRRLAHYLPMQDMLYCLRRGYKQHRYKRDLQTRDRPWKKKFFKDYHRARMEITKGLRRLEKAEMEKKGLTVQKNASKVKTKVKVVKAKEEKMWESAIREGTRAGQRDLRLRTRR